MTFFCCSHAHRQFVYTRIRKWWNGKVKGTQSRWGKKKRRKTKIRRTKEAKEKGREKKLENQKKKGGNGCEAQEKQ